MKIKGFKLFSAVVFMAFAVSAVILLVSFANQNFAYSYSNSVGAFLRYILAGVTGIVPFSLTELLAVVVLPVVVVFTLVQLVRGVAFKSKSALKMLIVVLDVVLICAVLFINTFGVCYTRPSLETLMKLPRKQITQSQLSMLSLAFSKALEREVKDVSFDKTGASEMPYSWDKLNEKLDKGYDRLRKDYSFISHCSADAKRILLSPLMTYTHISGIYMPITGEANVNTNYPDYVIAFSTAHEKAHQRGIAGEDEANFIAYLCCIYSEDDYLTYCAHMSMYDYLLSAMLISNEEEYARLVLQSPKEVYGEMYAYSVFFDKYRNSGASKVANKVNDTYLKTLGQEDGVESYGLVVELMASYANEYGI